MKKIIYYLKVISMMSKNSFLVWLGQKRLLIIFLLGKIMRFTLMFSFIFFLLKGSKSLAGYSLDQTIFFYLTFNLVDIVGQFLFREVYRFRSMLISGDFDLVLAKPFNALVRVLLGGVDLIDFITIPPLLVLLIIYASHLNPTPIGVLIYLALIINGLILSASFYISILAFAIVTFEIDNAVMFYRDLALLGMLPVDIYKEPLRAILTFIVPVGIMVTFPVKAMLGLLGLPMVIVSFVIGALGLFLSIRFWNFAIKKYTSASS